MSERPKITPEEAWGKTSARIKEALSDYEKYLETGEYPTQPSNQEKYVDIYIIHFSKKNIHFDSIKQILSLENSKIELTRTESRAFTALVQAAEKVQSFRNLYQYMHKEVDPNWVAKANKYQIVDNVRPIISTLRSKLDLIHPELRNCIVSVRGKGYFWDGEVTPDSSS